jgi:hypothetical protein
MSPAQTPDAGGTPALWRHWGAIEIKRSARRGFLESKVRNMPKAMLTA